MNEARRKSPVKRKTVNIHEAKTHLSRLLSEGDEIVIAKAGKPVARLLPIRRKVPDRKPGGAAGKIKIRQDFDAPLPEDVIAGFEE